MVNNSPTHTCYGDSHKPKKTFEEHEASVIRTVYSAIRFFHSVEKPESFIVGTSGVAKSVSRTVMYNSCIKDTEDQSKAFYARLITSEVNTDVTAAILKHDADVIMLCELGDIAESLESL